MSVLAPPIGVPLSTARFESAVGLQPEMEATFEQPHFAARSLCSVLDDEVLLEVADDDVEIATAGRTQIAWGGLLLSLLIHLWAGTNLSNWLMAVPLEPAAPVLESQFEERIKTEIDEAIPFELANPDDRELDVREVLNAMSVGLAQVTEPPKIAAPPKQLLDEARVEMAKLPAYDIPEGMQFDDRLVVKGQTGEQLVQIESALDRVTWEIAQNLRENKVLVVWMIDGSASLTKQREAIAKRLNRVYQELGALQEKTSTLPLEDRGLLSAVVMFGERMNVVAKPTVDVASIRDAIEKAPTDPSGKENIFTSVKNVLSLWSRYRVDNNYRIMLIAITDEAGDDFGQPHLEAIGLCRRYGAKAYVIGPTSPFGRRHGFVPYVAPEDGKTYQLPIDLGPEAPMAENVSLPFWFDGPQFDYLSSGFAPYALARLVSETGGVYFLTNMTTMAGLTPIGQFDDETLKLFAPDYRFGEPEEFARDLRKHPLRAAVINAALISQKSPVKQPPDLSLRVTDRNFRQVATDAQKKVAVNQYQIESMLQAFPPGIERELDREPSLRWRMAFCLNYGRLLANRTRNMEYNFALASLKTSLAESDINSRSNLWVFHPNPETNYSGASSRKGNKLAAELLTRVVAEAPGTPWAIMAERELRHPFGLKVEERFIPPPEPRPNKPAAPAPAKPRPLFFEKPAQKPQPPAPPPKPPVLPKL